MSYNVTALPVELVEGDTGTALEATIHDETYQPLVFGPSDTAALEFVVAPDTVGKSVAMSVTDRASGQVCYQFGAGDLTPGLMTFDVACTIDGETVTTNVFSLHVRPKIRHTT